MRALWLLILFPAKDAQGKFEHLLEDLNLPIILSGCVSTAADHFFEEGDVIMFMLPQNGTDPFSKSFLPFNKLLLGELHRLKKWSLMVFSPRMEKNPFNPAAMRRRFEVLNRVGKPDNYVMMVNCVQDIFDSLHYLDGERMLNPFANFIIINTQPMEVFEESTQEVLKKLWSYNILKGVILFPATNTSELFDVHTWNPFADGKCGEDVEYLIKIGICNMTVLRTSETWFLDKIPKNLNGCPVKVRTAISPPFVMDYVKKVEGTQDEYVFNEGIDIEIMNLVAEIVNFTVKYSMSAKNDDYGGNRGHFKNFSGFSNQTNFFENMNLTEIHSLRTSIWNREGMNASTGILDMLRDNRVDIGIGSMSIGLNSRNLEISFPYSQDALIFCVPHTDEVSHWKKLLNIIALKTWGITAFTIVLTFLALRTTARQHKEEYSIFKKSVDVASALLQVITANIITTQPRTTRVRIFLMLWIIFSLYFDTAYQTSLMSTLTKTDYEPQIETQEEIMKSKLDVLFLESSMQYFNNFYGDNPELTALKKRWQICHDLLLCMEQTAFQKTSAVATSRYYTEYEMGKYFSPKGQPLLYCFKKNILTFPIAMYMRNGFPLKHRINKLLYAIDAGGFVGYWVSSIFRKNLLYSKVVYRSDAHMTFKHFLPIFSLILFGNGLALAVFLGELFAFRYRQKHEVSDKPSETEGLKMTRRGFVNEMDECRLVTLRKDGVISSRKTFRSKRMDALK